MEELKEDLLLEISKPILIEDLGMMFANENSKKKDRYGIYKCGFCGTEFKACTSNIKNGSTKSCGCYHKRRVSESRKTHGLGSTRLYSTWSKLKDRVFNLKSKDYYNYGGRGITICEEWKNDFVPFYNWAIENGYEENKGLSIDRIDNDGNYEPHNCRWTTQTMQSRNQRMQKNNTSGYKGVYFKKDNNKYQAQIKVNKKIIYLGSYLNVIEGAIAYNNYIIENNLEGFILNEIPEEYLI